MSLSYDPTSMSTRLRREDRNVNQVDEGRTVTRTDQIQCVVHKLKMLEPPDKVLA